MKRRHIQTFKSYIQVSVRFSENRFQAFCSDDCTAPTSEVHSRSDRRHRLHWSVAMVVQEDRHRLVGLVTASLCTPLGRLPTNDVTNNQHSGDNSSRAKQRNEGKSKAIHLASDVIANYVSNGCPFITKRENILVIVLGLVKLVYLVS